MARALLAAALLATANAMVGTSPAAMAARKAAGRSGAGRTSARPSTCGLLHRDGAAGISGALDAQLNDAKWDEADASAVPEHPDGAVTPTVGECNEHESRTVARPVGHRSTGHRLTLACTINGVLFWSAAAPSGCSTNYSHTRPADMVDRPTKAAEDAARVPDVCAPCMAPSTTGSPNSGSLNIGSLITGSHNNLVMM